MIKHFKINDKTEKNNANKSTGRYQNKHIFNQNFRQLFNDFIILFKLPKFNESIS